MSEEKPTPVINADTRPFWEACRHRILKFQKCRACGHVRWPAAYLCPECHALDSEWVPVSGKGTVFSYVVYHVAYHPGFLSDVPYVVALVDIDEGPRFLSNITGCRPDEVYCDMPVEVAWEDRSAEVTLPKFRPRPA